MTTVDDQRFRLSVRAPIANGPPVFSTLADERLYRKQRLAAAARVLAKYELAEGYTGHLSARDPEFPDRFWMNPLTMPLALLRVSDLACVTFDGEILHGERPVSPAGFAIHSQILVAHLSVVSVVHTHAPHGVAWSTLGRLLDPISQDACEFYRSHALFDEYHGAVLDLEEGRAIAALAEGVKLVILKNHGFLTLGRSVEEAARYFLIAERVARVQLLAESAGTPTSISHDVATSIGKPRSYGGFSFAAYYDVIVREQPDLLE
jgi:ribulose-5-phosphate 4-epimerase/fuculose-1-phosphate aldolase